MARKSRCGPGRTLMCSSSAWSIDLRAGRDRRHLEARAGPRPAGWHPDHADRQGQAQAESLDEARKIIDQRVNGSGVSEAEVTTQGNRSSSSRSPASSRRDLLDTVKRQAQLRFRLVACSSQSTAACGAARRREPRPEPGARLRRDRPQRPARQPARQPAQLEAVGVTQEPGAALRRGQEEQEEGGPSASASPSPSAGPSASPSASPSGAASDSPTPAPDGGPLVDQPLKWMNQPDAASVKAFNEFSAPRTARRRSSRTTPTSRW